MALKILIDEEKTRRVRHMQVQVKRMKKNLKIDVFKKSVSSSVYLIIKFYKTLL